MKLLLENLDAAVASLFAGVILVYVICVITFMCKLMYKNTVEETLGNGMRHGSSHAKSSSANECAGSNRA